MIIFVYAKDGVIKARSDLSTNERRHLLADGWTHTATLDACRWLETWARATKEEREIEFAELRGERESRNAARKLNKPRMLNIELEIPTSYSKAIWVGEGCHLFPSDWKDHGQTMRLTYQLPDGSTTQAWLDSVAEIPDIVCTIKPLKSEISDEDLLEL